MRIRDVTLRLCLLLASVAAANAQPLDYPAQRMTIVVGFAAGGSVDAIARVIAEKLQERWGRPVVVENRTGATGNLAAAAVARPVAQHVGGQAGIDDLAAMGAAVTEPEQGPRVEQ